MDNYFSGKCLRSKVGKLLQTRIVICYIFPIKLIQKIENEGFLQRNFGTKVSTFFLPLSLFLRSLFFFSFTIPLSLFSSVFSWANKT